MSKVKRKDPYKLKDIKKLREWWETIPPAYRPRPNADLTKVNYGKFIKMAQEKWKVFGKAVLGALEPERAKLEKVTIKALNGLDGWFTGAVDKCRESHLRTKPEDGDPEYRMFQNILRFLDCWRDEWLKAISKALEDPLAEPIYNLGVPEGCLEIETPVSHGLFRPAEACFPDGGNLFKCGPEDSMHVIYILAHTLGWLEVPRDILGSFSGALEMQVYSRWAHAVALDKFMCIKSSKEYDELWERANSVSNYLADWTHNQRVDGAEYLPLGFRRIKHEEGENVQFLYVGDKRIDRSLMEGWSMGIPWETDFFDPDRSISSSDAEAFTRSISSRNAEAFALSMAALIESVCVKPSNDIKKDRAKNKQSTRLDISLNTNRQKTLIWMKLCELMKDGKLKSKRELASELGFGSNYLSRNIGLRLYEAAERFIQTSQPPTDIWYDSELVD
ncbi:MAG: hypothetical protein L3J82_07820 [Planctomycetes bacterium]|nr:hypothetical protein [Planctomycetota bacterium]